MPPSALTIPDMHKESGYTTRYKSKWGLCQNFEDGGVDPKDNDLLAATPRTSWGLRITNHADIGRLIRLNGMRLKRIVEGDWCANILPSL